MKGKPKSKVGRLTGPPEGTSAQRTTEFVGQATEFDDMPKWEESQSTQRKPTYVEQDLSPHTCATH